MTADEPVRRAAPSPELEAEAARHPGGSVAFAAGVDPPSGGFEILWGAHTVAVGGLADGGRTRSRVWFDLWTRLDAAEGQLHDRLGEVG
jgi:hypothetical protein